MADGNKGWLGAYLAKYPDHIDAIGAGRQPAAVPADLQPLFTDPDVIAVVAGGDDPEVTARLDSDVVRSIPLL